LIVDAMKSFFVALIIVAVVVGAVLFVRRSLGPDDGSESVTSDLFSQGKKVVESSAREEVEAPELPIARPFGEGDHNSDGLSGEMLLDAAQLAETANVAEFIEMPAYVLASVVEDELRKLDEGELERDFVLAQSGVDVSLGIGQVRISTAEYIHERIGEQYQEFSEVISLVGREELVIRLNDDSWCLAYAALYLRMLADANGDDYEVAAIKYPGHSGAVSEADRDELRKNGAGRFFTDFEAVFGR
jgi:hypothetical protein